MSHCIDCAVSRRGGQGLAAACLILFGLLPAGCASLEKSNNLSHRGGESVSTLPGWSSEAADGLRQAIQTQCRLPSLKAPWPSLCQQFSQIPTESADTTTVRRNAITRVPVDRTLKRWIRTHFDAWQLTNQRGAGRGLLTGYYEPLLTGSLQQESDSQVPLYAPPARPANDEPLPTRREIESGVAQHLLQGSELLWLDDPVDAFFLHIQGSGRIQLRSGEVVRAGFAGHNGHRYFAVGRALLSSGEIKRHEMSADRIRQWMRTNPARAKHLRWQNPRYIFFKLRTGLTASNGPVGSLQVPLTSFRSLATDKRFVPPGALVYVDTQVPTRSGPGVGLALTQDTGSAIRGPVRADLFTGSGHHAGLLAGELRQPMRMWLLWPKGQTPPGQIPVARPFTNP